MLSTKNHAHSRTRCFPIPTLHAVTQHQWAPLLPANGTRFYQRCHHCLARFSLCTCSTPFLSIKSAIPSLSAAVFMSAQRQPFCTPTPNKSLASGLLRGVSFVAFLGHSCQDKFFTKKLFHWWLRLQSPLLEDCSSVPSTHMRQLLTTHNPNSRVSDTGYLICSSGL